MQSIFHLVSGKVECWWGNLWPSMIQWRHQSQGKGAGLGFNLRRSQVHKSEGDRSKMESPLSGKWMMALWAWCMNWSASKLCLTREVAHRWRQDPRPMAASGFSSSASTTPSLTGGGCSERPPPRCLAGNRRMDRASAVGAFRCASDPLVAAISSRGRGVGWCPVTAE